MSKKKWSSNDISYLKRFASSKKLEDLAQRFDTDIKNVKAKLAELQLESKEGPVDTGATSDPLFQLFEQGLAAMHEEKWADAAEKLERVATESDLLDLTARARQYLAICKARHTPNKKDSSTDLFTLAVYHKNRGELDEALKLSQKHGKTERDLYLQASIHSLAGDDDKAESLLAKAIEMNEENRVHAFHDADFRELRDDEKYAHLFGLS